MDVRNFVSEIAYLSDAENPEQWSWIALKVFDEEVNNSYSEFRRNKDEVNPEDRLNVLFGFMAFKHDKNRAKHCKKLMDLMLLSHYRKDHGETKWDSKINALMDEIAILEDQNPDISTMVDTNMAVNSRWL